MQLALAVFIAIVIYVIQWKLTRKYWDKGLSVSLSFRDLCINTGESSVLTEVVTNEKLMPLPVFHVKFSTSRDFVFDDMENSTVTDSFHRNDAFSVMANQKITRTLSFCAKKRGYYTISNINILSKDLFMTRTFAKNVESTSQIYVLPEKLPAEDVSAVLSTLYGELSVKKSLIEDPYTFRGIREYTGGDTMRSINWKASARTGDLMVNLYGYAAMLRVRVLLNLEPNIMLREDYMAELAISLTCCLCENLLEKGVPVMLQSNGLDTVSNEPVALPYGATKEHGRAVDMALARIGKNGGLEAFLSIVDNYCETTSENETLVVVSPYFKEDLLTRLDNCKNRGKDVYMLVPVFDIEKRDGWRPYMKAWEVKFDEA